MKKVFIIIISMLLALAIWGYLFLYYFTIEHYKNDMKTFEYDATSTPETYKIDCQKEFENNVNFPLNKVTLAKLHYSNFLKFPKTLNKNQTNQILNILNDSSSYSWGEIGTPFFDLFISFHNSDGDCIGVTDVSIGEGQTYSFPSINRMKWGLLNEDARMLLIKELER